jgi:hypothetical protein
MEASFLAPLPASLDRFGSATWLPVKQPRRQDCPLCGSDQIFDVTAQLDPRDPAVQRVLSCRCGAVIMIYARRKSTPRRAK